MMKISIFIVFAFAVFFSSVYVGRSASGSGYGFGPGELDLNKPPCDEGESSPKRPGAVPQNFPAPHSGSPAAAPEPPTVTRSSTSSAYGDYRTFYDKEGRSFSVYKENKVRKPRHGERGILEGLTELHDRQTNKYYTVMPNRELVLKVDAGAGTSTSPVREAGPLAHPLVAAGAPPTTEQVKALLDSLSDKGEFCIHMRKSQRFYVGKFTALPKGYLPSWIGGKLRAPYSNELIYLFNPDRVNGKDAASEDKILIGAKGKGSNQKDVRVYVRTANNTFFTAYLSEREQGIDDPPVSQNPSIIHQIYVRPPELRSILQGTLTYLEPSGVFPIIIEKMGMIPI